MSGLRDPEIENLLGADIGRSPDVSLAYRQVQHRVRVLRRRRAATIGCATCVTLVGVAALTLARPNAEHMQTGDGSSPANTRQLRPSITTATSTTPESTSSTGVVTTTLDDVTSTTAGAATNIATPPFPSAATPDHTSTPGMHTPAATSTTPAVPAGSEVPATTATTAPSDRQTFVGSGGRITVGLVDGSLVLVSFQPEAGFTAEIVHPSGNHVEVHFKSDPHVTKARVDLESGQMQKKFEESNS